MSVQRTEEGTFLNICSFPEYDVLLFVIIALEATERNTNIALYRRNVSVENHSEFTLPLLDNNLN